MKFLYCLAALTFAAFGVGCSSEPPVSTSAPAAPPESAKPSKSAEPKTEPPAAPKAASPAAVKKGDSHTAPGSVQLVRPAAITGEPRKALLAPGDGNLDVAPRLQISDIQAATGSKSPFVPALLQGIKPSPTYGRARYAPEDRANYGVGLQVWREGDLDKAKTRLELHRKTYKDAAPSRAVGRLAITAKQHTILHLSWIRGDGSEVITLTCDERLCTKQQLATLARLVDRR